MNPFWRMPPPLREHFERFFQTNAEKVTPDVEDSVGLLDGTEKQHTPPSPLETNFPNRSRKAWLYPALFGVVLIIIALALPTKRITGIEVPFISATPASHFRQDDRFLHIVIPQIWSPAGSVELCKTVLSASTLDYPTPWTVSWNSTLNAEGKVTNATLAKIEHVSQWLNDMPEDREDDIVAILGNNKSWFQVRPEVLLKRYFGILQKGNKELGHYYSADVLESQSIGARVVFAAQKECPSKGTDKCQRLEAEDKSIHYLSSDFCMGPLKDLKLVWQYAASRARQLAAGEAEYDDHSIFASMQLEQEQYRQKPRPQRRLEDTEAAGEDSKEFGIALDFKGELSYAAPSNTDDIEWIKHEKTSKREARKWTSPPDMYLPKDIAASAPPFWTIDGADVPRNTSWHDVQLLTATGDNVVPAVIQRGPDSSPMLTSKWWKKLWSHPYARKLLDTFVLTPLMPVAILTDITGNETRYWSPHWQKVGMMQAENVKFKKWSDMCNTEQMAKAFFLDGQGIWVDPRP